MPDTAMWGLVYKKPSSTRSYKGKMGYRALHRVLRDPCRAAIPSFLPPPLLFLSIPLLLVYKSFDIESHLVSVYLINDADNEFF